MPETVGNIGTKWDEATTTLETRSWVRSDKQFFRTTYGSDFVVSIDMEKVTVDPDGKDIGHQFVCQLFARASDCASDPELGPHALALQTAFTALTGILYERWKAAQAAAVVPDPEPPVVTP